MPRRAKVTEKPVVWEARQISSDKDSDWQLVNTFNQEDVRVISNEEFEVRYQRSRAQVVRAESEPAQESDDAPLVPQRDSELDTGLDPQTA